MFAERKWERRHENGWTSVVVQTDEDRYVSYALDASGSREVLHESTNFGSAKSMADRDVLMYSTHKCACPDWAEVPYSPE